MKKAIMYGAGKIGRAFVGKKLIDSGYDVCFLDRDRALIDALNERGRYTVRYASVTPVPDAVVEGFSCLDSETDAAVEAISHSDLVCTSVGANSLPDIARVLAKAIARRMQLGGAPLNMLFCENKLSSDVVVREGAYACLNDAQRAWADEHIGFVPACIGTTAPVPTEAMRREDALMLIVEPYNDLPVDARTLRGEVPGVKGLVPFDPFEFYIKRKLFIHNGGHAICAYMGAARGHKYIHEAIADPVVYDAVRAHMRSCADALIARFGEQVRENVDHNIEDLLVRFANPTLMDTLTRVGADPARKLRRDDRITGAALFEMENGVDPSATVRGVIAALGYDAPDDPTAPEVQKLLRERGIGAVLTHVMGLQEDEPLYGTVMSACQTPVFRKAEMRDIPDIMRVVHEAQAFMKTLGIDQWQDGYPQQTLLEHDIALGQLYVFEDSAAAHPIASFSVLTPLHEPIYDRLNGAWLTDGAYLTVHRTALDDAHRGSGLAKKIMQNAFDMAREMGLNSVRADTHTGNRAMRRFLEKQGFVYCGTVLYDDCAGDPVRVAYEKVL